MKWVRGKQRLWKGSSLKKKKKSVLLAAHTEVGWGVGVGPWEGKADSRPLSGKALCLMFECVLILGCSVMCSGP